MGQFLVTMDAENDVTTTTKYGRAQYKLPLCQSDDDEELMIQNQQISK
jgi:hypothetical protein